MQPLLGRSAPSTRLTPRIVSAAAAAAAICAAFVYGVYNAERALHATPAAAPFLVLAACTCLGVALPLIVYCGTASEFGTEVHPLTPTGYKKIFLRTYAAAHAARGTGGRVQGKDL